MNQISAEPKNFIARTDKTINWLSKSRDDWKGKTQMTKAELKIAKQAQKRARQSRQEWRAECQQLEKEQAKLLEAKNEKIARLQTKVKELEHENTDLKKKYLLRLMTKG